MTSTTPNGPRSSRRRRRPNQPPAQARASSPAAPAPHASLAVDVAGSDPGGFAALGVAGHLVEVLARSGVTTPFPIQARTLPDALAGRDVLGRGKTGSGKTIAFALPIVTALSTSGERCQPGRPRALVLVPTRELANQVAATIGPLARAAGLRVATVYGGVGQGPQVNALRSGTDIVVACPGRLEDLMGQGHCRLDRIEVTVLDEADHMADLGFLPGVKRILDATPTGTQRLLFSATLDNGIDVIVRRFLEDPVLHSVDPEVSSVGTMTHHVLATVPEGKLEVVTTLASGRERALLFTRTKHGAKKLAKQLTNAGVPAVELHGNLSQGARERNLAAFADGSTRVLVATDIAARGIHVDDVALVIHVDPPSEHKAYLHRSGRTARAGASGVVITVMTPDQVGDVKALARAAAITPTITRVDASHPLLGQLTGPAAPRVRPPAAGGDRTPRRSAQETAPVHARDVRPGRSARYRGRVASGSGAAGRQESGGTSAARRSSPR